MVRRHRRDDAHFRVIAADLRARIDSGELQPGKSVGTEKVLSQRYDAGLWAIGAAIEELRRQGYLEPALPGRSAIVRERPPEREVTGRRGSTVVGRPATADDVERAHATGVNGVSIGTPVFVIEFGVETFIYPQDRLTLRFN